MPYFLGANYKLEILPGSRIYTLCSLLVDVTRFALGDVVVDIIFFSFDATRWALIE
jgi:hypothetical protein